MIKNFVFLFKIFKVNKKLDFFIFVVLMMILKMLLMAFISSFLGINLYVTYAKSMLRIDSLLNKDFHLGGVPNIKEEKKKMFIIS